MTRLPNEATPLTARAATVVLPLAKEPWLRAKVIRDESAVMMVPAPSSAATTIGGLRATPALPGAGGSVVKTRACYELFAAARVKRWSISAANATQCQP